MTERAQTIPDEGRAASKRVSSRQLLLALLVAGGLIRLILSWRELEVLDALFFPDDTYLSLGIARNLALGLGSTFDGQTLTNGYQPLYVWLMVPVYWLFPNDLTTPIHIAETMLALVAVLTGWLIYRIVSRLATPWHALVACAVWMLDPLVIRHGLNGLETGLALLGVAATTDCYIARVRGRDQIMRRDLLMLGLLAGLTILTRVDQVLLLAAIGLDMLLVRRNRRTLVELAGVGLVALLVNLPWLAYSLSIGSGLLPESGAAVRFNAIAQAQGRINWYVAALILMLSVVFTTPYSTFVVLLGAITTFVARRFRRQGNQWLVAGAARLRPLRFAAFYSLGLFLAYWLYIPAYWFFDRYEQPIALMALMAGVLLLPEPAALRPGARQKLMLALGIFFALETALSLRMLVLTPAPDNYLAIGRWANQNLAGTTVGSYQTGAIGYWGQQIRVVNLDGVVDSDALRARVEGRLGQELLRREVDWVIDWEDPPQVGLPGDNVEPFVTFHQEIPGITTWGATWYLYKVKR